MDFALSVKGRGIDMRRKIYDIIEVGSDNPGMHHSYSVFMLICIVISLIPLGFRDTTELLESFDKVTVVIFIIDYIMRLGTADLKYEQGGVSFLKYPFSPMAVIDLLSILPSLTIINQAFKTLRIFRATELSRVLRVTKMLRVARSARYSKSATMLGKVVRDSRESLVLLSVLAIGYIFTTALVIFNVEPQTFKSYFDALYWATVSLTTVGYGDLYSVTTIGRIISMISSFAGIAIVSLPSAIITAGFVRELDAESHNLDAESHNNNFNI